MNHSFKNYIYYILASILLVSCNLDDFLDTAPDSNLDEETVFTVFTNAEKFQADIYSNLKARFNAVGDYQPVPLSSASDESDSQQGYHGTTKFNIGNYDGLDDNLSNSYAGIRKANLFLSKKDVIPFPTEKKKNQMLGEVYFLRAFYFNEVVKRFGGMPIMDENSLLYPNDDLNLSRNTYKECVDFILGDLGKAIDLLPVDLSETEYGRATKGAAMALKARVLLFAASPLWQSKMGENLWSDAANAALAVINLKDDDGNLEYELYNTGNGADDYAQLFFTRREGGNKEVIFAKQNAPVGFSSDEIKVWSPKGGAFGGDGAVCPTENFVELFEKKGADGNYYPITDARAGYDAQNPYKDLDPRFYKTVLYNGSEWQGETLDLTYNEVTDSSGANRKDKTSYTRTGYYVRKYLPESVEYLSSNTAYHNWIYFRLAEMYLDYAEARNEMLSAPDDSVYDAVNKIRERSGVTGIPYNSLSKDQMRERIWNERAVELSFEEHRWWDARRWMKAEDWFGGSMYEMEVRKKGSTLTYTKKTFYTRIFRSYMNLYPIPTSEMQKNPLYTQNPGW
ncbi:MAG: RagB/SusD family nutrient uptake outer membrane protein [Paludibacter sp.]|nr:RagB/SusD family nutrient uptake outer membrane protein [Paludibacter sp.]